VVAIVTHGGPIRCIFKEVLKLGELKKIGNGSIVLLEKDCCSGINSYSF
jgi:broad specificity phosphatase PhoE